MSVPLVLLGAGASAEAGVPMSFDMTKAVVERLNEQWTLWTGALNFVCGALIAHDASKEGANPYGGLDVERVFAAIELLSRRNELDVTPFVSAWHPSVEEWDVIKYVNSAFDDQFYRVLDARGDPHLITSGTASMGELIAALVDDMIKGEKHEIYRQIMDDMVSALVGLLGTEPDAVDYLRPLALLGRDAPGGLTVATLNYDLAVEQAAKAAGVVAYTGIAQWAEDGQWRWPDAGIRLLKLHGSIDWEQQRSFGDGWLEQEVVVPVDDPADVGMPSLVFGHGAKLKAQGPFLSLLGEFERQLSVSSELVVVGYSFRDDHVNELLRRWLNEDQARVMTVIDPAFPEADADASAERAFPQQLRRAFGVVEWARDADPAARLRLFRGNASDGLLKVLA